MGEGVYAQWTSEVVCALNASEEVFARWKGERSVCPVERRKKCARWKGERVRDGCPVCGWNTESFGCVGASRWRTHWKSKGGGGSAGAEGHLV